MTRIGKRHKANTEIAERITTPQSPEDAIKALKSFKAPKFDQAVEVCACLGIDPK